MQFTKLLVYSIVTVDNSLYHKFYKFYNHKEVILRPMPSPCVCPPQTLTVRPPHVAIDALGMRLRCPADPPWMFSGRPHRWGHCHCRRVAPGGMEWEGCGDGLGRDMSWEEEKEEEKTKPQQTKQSPK